MRKFLSKIITIILAAALICSLGIVSAYAAPPDPNNAHISGSGVNFRKGPGTSYAVKGVYSYGTSVTLLEELENGWCRVSIFGIEGFVYGAYVTRGDNPANPINLDITTYMGEAGYVNTNNVNLRSQPSTNSVSLGTLLKGTQVDLLTYLSSGWYGVMVNGHPGFIFCDYITVGAYDPSIEFVTSWPNVATMYCNIGGVVVRSAPSSNAPAIGTLPIYVEVETQVEYSNGWYGIAYQSVNGAQLTGYVLKNNLDDMPTIIADVVPVKVDISDFTGYICVDKAEWRTGPGTEFQIAMYFNKGQEVTVTQQYEDQYGKVIWYEVYCNGLGPGCVFANYVVQNLSDIPSSASPVTSWPVGAVGFITVDNAPVYHISGNGAVIGYLANNTQVTVDTELSNGWLIITIPAGPCYIYKTYVSY